MSSNLNNFSFLVTLIFTANFLPFLVNSAPKCVFSKLAKICCPKWCEINVLSSSVLELMSIAGTASANLSCSLFCDSDDCLSRCFHVSHLPSMAKEQFHVSFMNNTKMITKAPIYLILSFDWHLGVK